MVCKGEKRRAERRSSSYFDAHEVGAPQLAVQLAHVLPVRPLVLGYLAHTRLCIIRERHGVNVAEALGAAAHTQVLQGFDIFDNLVELVGFGVRELLQ